MKEWIITHKIKALYDEGEGLSRRGIAEEPVISRDIVAKYLSMSEEEIGKMFQNHSRAKELDRHWDFFSHLIRKFPRLSAVKARRRLEDAGFGH